ncbi:uncharacterized protein LOC144576786 [Callithrix jacchus]
MLQKKELFLHCPRDPIWPYHRLGCSRGRDISHLIIRFGDYEYSCWKYSPAGCYVDLVFKSIGLWKLPFYCYSYELGFLDSTCVNVFYPNLTLLTLSACFWRTALPCYATFGNLHRVTEYSEKGDHYLKRLFKSNGKMYKC